MPLPILSKESLSSSEQKKKDEEKTFSVTILVNENEKNKIVDLLHKAKSIISKKVEKVMGKKPKTGISNVDALQTVLENWLDKTESEEREEDRLVEQLIQEQESQVETMLMDGKYAPVTYPTVPTISPPCLSRNTRTCTRPWRMAMMTSVQSWWFTTRRRRLSFGPEE